MNSRILLTLCFLMVSTLCQAVEVSSGTLKKLEPFGSELFPQKNVFIWLPEGYSTTKKYAVLYMHDAQNLFDADSTWNKQAWDVDDVGTELMAQGRVKDFIVVAAFNGNHNGKFARRNEYFPQKVFESLTPQWQQRLVSATSYNQPLFQGEIRSDDYLKFLTQELKPYVDKHYSVHTDKDNTFVMGSSMGGLISLYAISEYPDIFGGAACLSTHWPGGNPEADSPIPEAFAAYMRENLPVPDSHKIYFDLGTETLDQYYPPYQALADKVMREKGYDYQNWITNTFVGDGHEERFWQARLHIPLLFLLGQ